MRTYSERDQRRFWSKVKIGRLIECWPWRSAKPGAYGRFGMPRADRPGWEILQAHRVVWELLKGEIPEGLDVCHTCDDPPCCNWAHLFLGTHLENMGDAAKKGRFPKRSGEKTGTHRLTDAKVISMRERYSHGLLTEADLALEAGVSQSTAGRAIHGRSWTHLPGAVPVIRKTRGVAGDNAKKSHCSQGHPYSGENLTIICKRRVCKQCNRAKTKRCRDKKIRDGELKSASGLYA